MPSYLHSALAIVSFFLLASKLQAEPAQWPSYRGLHASGVDTRSEAPREWDIDSGKNILWRTPLPGLGLSSPVVWGDDIFLTTAVAAKEGDAKLKVGLYGDIASSSDDGEQSWRVLCIDRRSGKVRWNVEAHAGIPKFKRHPKASHANPSVATDGKHVVAFFGSEGLYCYDREGEQLWTKSLGDLDSGYFRRKSAQWGFASSPVIHDGRVIVQCDIQEGSFIAAFDVTNGEEIWRTERDEVPTWGTPTITKVGDKTQIVVNGFKHIGGYDFETGKAIWWLHGGGDIPVPTPIVAHGLFFITNAHGKMAPIYAIKADATGEIVPESEEKKSAFAWWQRRRGNYMQTPIVVGDYLFCCTDSGIASCYDARGGERQFLERLRDGKSGFGSTASPVSDGKTLYYPTEDGQVFLIEAGPEFKKIGKQNIGESCMATPALIDGILYFRTRHHLLAIGKSPEE